MNAQTVRLSIYSILVLQPTGCSWRCREVCDAGCPRQCCIKLNRSRLNVVGRDIFDSDVVSGVVLDPNGMDVHVKIGDSRSNFPRDIRDAAHFVIDDERRRTDMRQKRHSLSLGGGVGITSSCHLK